jgi:hypothetical protein
MAACAPQAGYRQRKTDETRADDPLKSIALFETEFQQKTFEQAGPNEAKNFTHLGFVVDLCVLPFRAVLFTDAQVRIYTHSFLRDRYTASALTADPTGNMVSAMYFL